MVAGDDPLGPGSDPQLVARCLLGDENTWHELVRSHSALVGAIARRILRRNCLPDGEGEVEEAIADFFGDLCVRRAETLGRFRGESSLRAYLAVLAANHVRKRAEGKRREEARLVDYARLASRAGEGPTSPGSDRPEPLAALSGLLARCSPPEQLLYQLLYVDGLSAEQAAAFLGIARDAVYLRKHRFHQRLRALMEERSRGGAGSPAR